MKKRLYKLLFLFFILGVSSIGDTGSSFVSSQVVSGNIFSTSCWTKPSIPVLTSPQNNSFADLAWLSDPKLTWSESVSTCPSAGNISYQYESYFDASLTQLAYRSEWLSNTFIPAPGTPDNIYYWRVRARDSFSNTSDFSLPWKFTVDRSFATPPQHLGWKNPSINCGGYTNSYTATADWDDSGSLSGIKNYTYEVNYPKLDDTIGTWQTTVSSSQYSGVFNQGQGVHTYRVRATNNLNQTSGWSQDCSVTYDTEAPTSKLKKLPYSTDKKQLKIKYSVEDNFAVDHTKLCYAFNDGPFLDNNCSLNFDFNFPDGVGTYYFYTQATDKAGNIEVPNIHTSDAVIYDVTPPTTNLDISNTAPKFSGQNLLNNESWSLIGNGQYLSENSFKLGIGGSDSIDTLVQKIILPHNLSSNLSFSYDYTSGDTAEYDFLNVGVSTGANIYDILNVGFSGTSGLRTISHSLLQWAGQTIDLFFRLTNSGLDPEYSTTVLLNNITISPLDLRTGDTMPVHFLATDLGSGVGDTPTIVSHISSTDLAGNIEATHSISIVTLPPVVLNKITSTTISLYNNTDSAIDLENYSLDVGTTTILSGTIPSFTARDFEIPVTGTTVTLFDNSMQKADSTIFKNLSNTTWQRQSNGLGPWTMVNAPVTLNLFSRLSESKITMTISGLGTTGLANMDYTINYIGGGIERQIAGKIDPNSIDLTGTVSRDFYLGTCSTGVCRSTGVGSTFTVMFSTDPTPKIFTLK